MRNDWNDAGGGESSTGSRNKMTIAEATAFQQVQQFNSEMGTFAAQYSRYLADVRNELDNSTDADPDEIGFKNANTAASTAAMFDKSDIAALAASLVVFAKRVGNVLEGLVEAQTIQAHALDKYAQAQSRQPISALLSGDDEITGLALSGGLTPPTSRIVEDRDEEK